MSSFSIGRSGWIVFLIASLTALGACQHRGDGPVDANRFPIIVDEPSLAGTKLRMHPHDLTVDRPYFAKIDYSPDRPDAAKSEVGLHIASLLDRGYSKKGSIGSGIPYRSLRYHPRIGFDENASSTTDILYWKDVNGSDRRTVYTIMSDREKSCFSFAEWLPSSLLKGDSNDIGELDGFYCAPAGQRLMVADVRRILGVIRIRSEAIP